VCFDTGCSQSITNSLDDFEEPPTKGDFGTVKTMTGTTKIKAFGIIRWVVYDVDGTTRLLHVPVSSKLVEMDRSSLPIEVEEGLGRRIAVAEAILWAEQESEIVMFVISCLLLAKIMRVYSCNRKSIVDA
jgi:hypothetical protein